MASTVRGIGVSLLVSLLVACGDDGGGGSSETGVSEPGNYSGYSERIYAGFEISSQYVTVREGTKLAIDIYHPLEQDGRVVETPLPVLWMHMPYGRRVPGNLGGFTPYENLDLPWHPVREADVEPLVPGEPVQLRFDILPFSMVFAAGHKIRLILTFAGEGTTQLTPAPTVSVYRDTSHPSSIELPIIEPRALPPGRRDILQAR